LELAVIYDEGTLLDGTSVSTEAIIHQLSFSPTTEGIKFKEQGSNGGFKILLFQIVCLIIVPH